MKSSRHAFSLFIALWALAEAPANFVLAQTPSSIESSPAADQAQMPVEQLSNSQAILSSLSYPGWNEVKTAGFYPDAGQLRPLGDGLGLGESKDFFPSLSS